MIKNLHTAPQLENSFTAWSETLRIKLEAKLDELYSSNHQLVLNPTYQERSTASQHISILTRDQQTTCTSENLQVAVAIWAQMRACDRLAVLEKHLTLCKTHKESAHPNIKQLGSTSLFCRIFVDEFVDIIQQFKD